MKNIHWDFFELERNTKVNIQKLGYKSSKTNVPNRKFYGNMDTKVPIQKFQTKSFMETWIEKFQYENSKTM